jgi:hypothetical protein
MSDTLGKIQRLIRQGDLKISEHGYDELADDRIRVREVVSGAHNAVLVEDYPDFAKGPCVLVLQKDQRGNSIHVVWGMPKGSDSVAVLVTAYRPDPERWDQSFLRRVK